MYAYSVYYFVKLINWERKGSFTKHNTFWKTCTNSSPIATTSCIPFVRISQRQMNIISSKYKIEATHILHWITDQSTLYLSLYVQRNGDRNQSPRVFIAIGKIPDNIIWEVTLVSLFDNWLTVLLIRGHTLGI